MTLPNITFNFRRSNTPTNPQDLTGNAMIVGPCSSGPVNTPTRFDQISDTVPFGTGSGIEEARAVLLLDGGPVYFTRSTTTTASVTSSVTKVFANPVGTPVISFGSVIAAGADNNGDVLIEAKDSDVSIVINDPGVVTASTLVNVAGKVITVTLKHDSMAITETGTGLAAAIVGTPAALALVSAVALGTGASLAGPLTSTALNDGALRITALAPGILYRVIVSGTSTPFSTTYSAGTITVNCATNANGEPTTTAGTAYTSLVALAAANPNVFSVAEVGAGTKLLGAKSITMLPFGSNGTGALTGTASDQFDAIIQVTQGGTVGGATAIILIWSVDGGYSYSSPATGVVSPSGVLLLKDSLLDTGLTFTLTGTVDTGDKFLFTTTLPTSGSTDTITAVDAAILETGFKWGYLSSPTSVDRGLATLLENRLQGAFQDRFIRGIFNTRDIGEGVPGETEAQWITALNTDFAGFISQNGAMDIAAGSDEWLSPYLLRKFRRPLVFFAASRYSSMPIHEDYGKTASDTSSLNNVLSISHDEFKHPGLDDQRFLTSRTYSIGDVQGRIFMTRSVTMADPANVGFTKSQWSRMAMGTAYNVKNALFQFLLSKLQIIPVAGSPTVPAGALSATAANKIKNAALSQMNLYLGSIKTDGEVSASFWDCEVPRNYNFAQTRNLLVNLIIFPDGVVERITVPLVIQIPA